MGDDVTRILDALERGDAQAAANLMPLVYNTLKRLAANRMAGERDDHTLQATALVHEAWIKMAGPGHAARNWNGRRHFFAAAAEAMRRVLIDHARRRRAGRRGGNWERVTLGEREDPSLARPDEVIDLDEALRKLERIHPDKAQLAKLRIYSGLTIHETASAMELSRATVNRHWSYTKAWLTRELRGDGNAARHS